MSHKNLFAIIVCLTSYAAAHDTTVEAAALVVGKEITTLETAAQQANKTSAIHITPAQAAELLGTEELPQAGFQFEKDGQQYIVVAETKTEVAQTQETKEANSTQTDTVIAPSTEVKTTTATDEITTPEEIVVAADAATIENQEEVTPEVKVAEVTATAEISADQAATEKTEVTA